MELAVLIEYSSCFLPLEPADTFNVAIPVSGDGVLFVR